MDIDPLSHVVSRLSHAVLMVTRLIPYTSQASLDPIIRIACLEDWFTNYRLLIEFLLMRPPPNCASAKTLVPGWTERPGVKAQLMADYGRASEDVSHIGQPSGVGPGSSDPSALRKKAVLILRIVEEVADAMAAEESDYEPMVRLAIDSARGALASL